MVVFDLPVEITEGLNTVSFAYGPDRARYKRIDTSPAGITTMRYAGGGTYKEISRSDGALEKKHYIAGVALVTETATAGTSFSATRYLSFDHLGSLDAVTDEQGKVVERFSFDAFGKRRQANWLPMSDVSLFTAVTSNRGFTFHEMIDPVGLIHMNGRVYDPELGRFLSADPVVQDHSDLQSLNRYSYVLNNPLSLTDPSGFFSFGGLFKSIGNALKSIGKAIGNLVSGITSAIKTALNKVPLLRTAVQIVACGFGPIACVGAAGVLTLASGGSIGSALQAMAMSAFNIGVWTEVGAFLEPLKALGIGGFAVVKGAVHGAVGGAMAVLQGGQFLAGFAANAIGGVGGVFSSAVSQNNVIADTMMVAAIGGTASVVSGGKFANGAVTAAFAYLYNQAAHNGRDPNDRHELGRQEAMADASKNGYEIFRKGPTRVSLPGLAPRIYDFVVLDPVTDQQIGIEVKTSWLETIFLNALQVNFDVTVVNGALGAAVGSGGVSITGVQYYTYCFQCLNGEAQLRSYVLQGRLELAGIPTNRGRRLSQ